MDGGRIDSGGLPRPRQGFDYEDELSRGTNPTPKYGGGKGLPDKTDYEPSLKGRWPQNLVLVHTKLCLREGERRVKGAGWRDSDKRTQSDHIRQLASDGRDEGKQHYTDADGLETVSTWRCLIACPECGYTWLAVDKEVCPECKAMGEWTCPVRRLGEQCGERPVSGTAKLGKLIQSQERQGVCYGRYGYSSGKAPNDSGDCTRYFFQADWSYEIAERLAMADLVHYCPKSSRRERDAGLEGFPTEKHGSAFGNDGARPHTKENYKYEGKRHNNHPCCKPLSLNRYLAGLLLPPPEYAPRRILVPFAGVMSEAIGAMLANFEEIVAIEMDAEYCEIGEARMKYWASRPEQMKLF